MFNRIKAFFWLAAPVAVSVVAQLLSVALLVLAVVALLLALAAAMAIVAVVRVSVAARIRIQELASRLYKWVFRNHTAPVSAGYFRGDSPSTFRSAKIIYPDK